MRSLSFNAIFSLSLSLSLSIYIYIYIYIRSRSSDGFYTVRICRNSDWWNLQDKSHSRSPELARARLASSTSNTSSKMSVTDRLCWVYDHLDSIARALITLAVYSRISAMYFPDLDYSLFCLPAHSHVNRNAISRFRIPGKSSNELRARTMRCNQARGTELTMRAYITSRWDQQSLMRHCFNIIIYKLIKLEGD
jgi:hypothetical protein